MIKFFAKFHRNLIQKFEVIAYISNWAFFGCSQSCLCFLNMSLNVIRHLLWQQSELVSELESDLQYTDDWGRKRIVHFNTGSIDMKIDWSVLDEK